MEFVAFCHLHVKLGRCHMSHKVRIRVLGGFFTVYGVQCTVYTRALSDSEIQSFALSWEFLSKTH